MRELDKIFTQHDRYNMFYLPYPHPLMNDLYLSHSGDNERGYTKTKQLLRRRSGTQGWNQVLWSVGLSWENTQDEDYDFVSMEVPDTSTAYKRGRRFPAKEIRFKLVGSWASDGQEPERAAGELAVLRALYRVLDESSASLESWSSSPYDMLVHCFRCRHENVIERSMLRRFMQQGLLLDAVMNRLTCQKCGQRKTRSIPVPTRA